MANMENGGWTKYRPKTYDQQPIFMFGERGSGTPPREDLQDFYKLREQCLQTESKFEDPTFLPEYATPDSDYEWLRPEDITDDPQLFVDGYSRFDVQQGRLGDCWFIAAVANLTLDSKRFCHIIPGDQSFTENYAGIFHFRFWQYGRWVDVVVDDRLPTVDRKLVFVQSTEENEFWAALLEKAYAKLHGSYRAIENGCLREAMQDFTGGVTEKYDLKKDTPNLFQVLYKAHQQSSLTGCCIKPCSTESEIRTSDGLYRGHSYSIINIIETSTSSGNIALIHLRNPWGNEAKWTGPWSDNASEWSSLTEQIKEQIGLKFDADGEFWMSFEDFQTHFDRLELCNLNPFSLREGAPWKGKEKWNLVTHEGEWDDVTAGGCIDNTETFCHNPQYVFTVTEPDREDKDGKCNVVISLIQKNRRSTGRPYLSMGFAVYNIADPDNMPPPLDNNFFMSNKSEAIFSEFTDSREVCGRFKLPPGCYCIVPSTYDANEIGEFMLRVFSERMNRWKYKKCSNKECVIHSWIVNVRQCRARSDGAGVEWVILTMRAQSLLYAMTG